MIFSYTRAKAKQHAPVTELEGSGQLVLVIERLLASKQMAPMTDS